MTDDFRLGDWIVIPQRRTIARGDRSVHIKPKPMAVLQCLAAAEGRTVSRNELFDSVWPGGEVSDETLTKCVVELRKAFGDTARESRVIETIPKLGFRLVLPVEPLEDEPAAVNEGIVKRRGPDPQVRRGRGRTGLLALAAVIVVALLIVLLGPRLWSPAGERSGFRDEAGTPTSRSPRQQPGIAVLPFVNMSSDPGNEYFSVGISEEILNALAATNTLPVIARTSSFQFNSGSTDIREVGRLLNVSHVLEGSVRRADGKVRVSAQVVDAASGLNIWADVYERELIDILEVQADITRQVVGQVTLALGGDLTVPSYGSSGTLPSMDDFPASIEAYEQHLIGTQLLASYDPIPVEKALEYFDRAIALDPDYADAWAGRGRALHVRGLGNRGHRDMPSEVYPQAMAAYRRALEIEPQHAFAMGFLGELLILNDFKWAEGLQLMKQSVDINPNDAEILARYGIWMEKMNQPGSREILERAFSLDPFGITPTITRANHLGRQGRWLDALEVVETILVGKQHAYMTNSYAAFFNLGAAWNGSDVEQIREALLKSAEERLRRAREVAHPVDFSLDFMERALEAIPTGSKTPWEELLKRAENERLDRLMIYALNYPFEDPKLMVAAFDLAIEQRDHEVCGILFGPKPPLMPEEDWHRMKEITGVTQFQAEQQK